MNNEPKKSRSESMRAHWQDPERRAKHTEALRLRREDPEYRAKLSASLKGHKVSSEARTKISAARTGKPLSDEHKAVLSQRSQELWQDPEYRTKVEQRLHDPDVQAKLRVPNVKKSITKKAWWDSLDPDDKMQRIRKWVEAGGKGASEKLKGRIYLPSTIEKMQNVQRNRWTPALRKKHADIRHQWWQLQPPETKLKLNISREALGHRTGPSNLEKRVARELERLGISSEKEKLVGTYRLDFYLPDYHLDLECDGEYWHNQPRHIANDQRRDKYLTDLGYRVYRLSGKQITTDVATAVQLALANVSP